MTENYQEKIINNKIQEPQKKKTVPAEVDPPFPFPYVSHHKKVQTTVNEFPHLICMWIDDQKRESNVITQTLKGHDQLCVETGS